VDCHCGSVLNHGDLSVLSFHATKVFNTFEGGAIICRDIKSKERIDFLKNFGYANETAVVATGINGKMSEFNAALGLLQLKHIDSAIESRRAIDEQYRLALANVPGIRCVSGRDEMKSNYAYFPIIVDDDFPLSRDNLYALLQQHNIHARRYFYPLISEFPMYRGLLSANPKLLPNAHFASSRIICLPIYPDLGFQVAGQISKIIQNAADSNFLRKAA
jgi:dTDP-4-amino-4,6-dideoxygalactose transaminase